MLFDWATVVQSLPALLRAAGTTVWLSVLAIFFGMALGTLLGVIRAFAPSYLSVIAQLYIGLIRGTPLVVQIMFFYFALPMLMGIRLSATTAGLIALIANSAAYLAEIVRGGFLAVPKGLKEAGLAMGLPLHKVISSIIAPVAFRGMIPALGNQFIIGVKDTSLLIVIGVAELTRTGQEIMTQNYRAVEIWFTVAAIYLIILSVLSYSLRWVEQKVRIS
ncbi:ABC transporter permease subunit [Shinella zoogloeoides]|uniref:ABC transporter permease subunit n=1 Tax=Shinella zoogloeoides TaxID=352475 RepID=UPI00299D870A|nr:ABC transporter permease subunit [Shinella zoogloeoides]WPE24267.1 Glutamine transport system permease protein GlnP [Shinella zoogloeoides]